MKTRQGGFTLIELLAAILISGIVFAGLYSVFVSQQTAFSAQEEVAEMNQNIRATLDLMTREIRLAGYKTSTATFNGVQTATSSTLRILADINQDGDTADADEDITYYYGSPNCGAQQICRGVNLPIADNITSFSFSYTLANGTVTSSPADLTQIRKVNISITAQTAHADRWTGVPRTMTLTTDVTPRNLALGS